MSEQNKYHLPIAIIILAVLGVLLSAVSLYEHTRTELAKNLGLELKSSFCNINAEFNCDAVNASAWSVWAGIPLASYGLVFYFVLLLLGIFARNQERFSKNLSSSVFLALSLFSACLSVFLFFVSKFFIGTFCLMCMGLYLVNILLLLCSLFLKPAQVSFFEGIKAGFLSLFKFPAQLFGLTPAKNTSLLRLVSVAVVFFSLGVLALPQLFSLSLQDALASQVREAKLPSGIVKKWREESEQQIDLKLDNSPFGDYYKGPLDAPIKLVEFADFECPACQHFYFEIEDLLAKYEGKILYIFKDFPLDNACNPAMQQAFHLNACFASLLARCAGEQGAFWKMADYFFSLASDNSFNHDDPKALKAKMAAGVKELGLDRVGIEACLNEGRYIQAIVADVEQGLALGIKGTPTVFINGKRVPKLSFESMDAIVEAILRSS